MPAGIGSPSAVSPTTSLEVTTLGRIAWGMARMRSSWSSHAPRRMSKRSVREAFVASVTWTRPAVSCQTSQVSTVPNASRPATARSLAPGTESRSQRIFVPEK